MASQIEPQKGIDGCVANSLFVHDWTVQAAKCALIFHQDLNAKTKLSISELGFHNNYGLV